jgi:rare lipoprotein A
MHIFIVKCLFLFFVFILSACSDDKIEKNIKLQNIFVTEGYACWYGNAFEGKKTANGEIFRKNKLTAAHRYLEFGTKIRVINPENNESVIVEINDRGPYSKGKILDLSENAAKKIGLYEKGTALVHIEICGYNQVNFVTVYKHYSNICHILNQKTGL